MQLSKFASSPATWIARSVLLFILCSAGTAQAQLRVVTYNIAQTQGNEAALQEVIESLMVDDKPGFAAPVSVFIFQEVRNADIPVLENIIAAAAPPGVLYATGTYTNINRDPVAGAQAMFFRAGMLLEDQDAHLDIFTGGGRYSDRWRLRLLGYDSPDASFYIYSSHLKASSGGANEQERLVGVQALRDDADALPVGTHVIYTGDMNFYHNSESGYLYFLSGGNGQAFDPLGTGTWAGPGNAFKHSQSPREFQSGGLIGGGMNSRFDFQLSTGEFQDGMGLSIIDGTYRPFGNDGQHYDGAINDGNNFYYPGDIVRSNNLADALHDASDHIPVVVDYQVPARMAANINPSDFGRVIQNAPESINLFVQNTAPFVTDPIGADLLDYTATGDGVVVVGQVAGQVEVDTPDINSLPVDTSIVGDASGTITFLSTSEAVQNGEIEHSISGTVVRPSAPSFDENDVIDELQLDIEVDSESGVHEIDVPVHNAGFDSLQALLNLTSIDGLQPPFAYESGLASDIGEEPATLTFSFDTTGLPDDLYEAELTIQTSDEDLPGASTSQLALSIDVTVGNVPGCPADLDESGGVNVSDLLALLSDWGPCEDCPADLDDSGVVNVSDLLALLAAWGPCQ